MPEPDIRPVAADMGTAPAVAVSIEWIQDFAQRWLEAWNSHEVDRVLELMTEDVEYHDDVLAQDDARIRRGPRIPRIDLAGDPGHDLRGGRRVLCDTG